MKTSQKLTRLGPRIKLVKRHLREWNDLLLHQKEVSVMWCRFLKTDTARTVRRCDGSPMRRFADATVRRLIPVKALFPINPIVESEVEKE
jgi:hypothetical protein